MKKYILLIILSLLFLVTRIYKISQIPESVYWDEASIGYNAYSISTDLKDEWNNFLPIHFRAFGEFKLPIYIYTVATLTKFFGLNEISLRLPAVLFSLGSVVTLYLLVYEVTKDDLVSFLSAFIFSISPWTFIFSRTGFEATAGLFFFLLFIYFLLLYQKNKTYIIFATLFSIASVYSYNAFRILTPLVILFWPIIQKSRDRKFEIFGLCIFLLSLIPIVRLYLYDSGTSRLSIVGAASIIDIIKNYFYNFDPRFLFLTGDAIKRHVVPGWGELYWIDLPLIIIGFWKTIRSKNPNIWFFIFLFFIAPIPAAITKESPHALRSILMAPTFAFISAMGLSSLKKYVLYFGVFSYLIFFTFYLRDFLFIYTKESSSDWQSEYKQIVDRIDLSQKHIVITDKYAQPYIFVLYYLKYPPREFRSTVKYNSPDKWGFSTVSSFGKFEFK